MTIYICKAHDDVVEPSMSNCIVCRLSACELERDEHRKALRRLSAFLHNPALEVPGDKSFSDALVEYALAELKGRADRLQDELKQNDILQREIDTIKAVAEGEIKALSSRLDEVSKQADRYVEEERREGERRLHELTAVLRAERDMWRKQHDHLAEQITKGVLLRPAPPILIDNLDRVRELESRLGSVRKLLELDVDDDRRWDEMAKLFPGVEVKAGVVERQRRMCNARFDVGRGVEICTLTEGHSDNHHHDPLVFAAGV